MNILFRGFATTNNNCFLKKEFALILQTFFAIFMSLSFSRIAGVFHTNIALYRVVCIEPFARMNSQFKSVRPAFFRQILVFFGHVKLLHKIFLEET